ncbi:MAG: hypothetical protein Ta2G_12760 [Termitinemataceae bacterium]|nr:MAG: hypothetical protein Ta2G_12760 [Termitinemataceae bacterium]
MKCGICKATTEEKLVTYTEDVNDAVIIIRNVPGSVCTECGNVWYTGTVITHLEKIVNRIMSGMISEVSIVNYKEKAA